MTPSSAPEPARSARRRRRAGRDPAGAPRKLRARAISANVVLLAWQAPSGPGAAKRRGHRRKAHPARYRVYRDGRAIGRTSKARFTDAAVTPGSRYRYTVRALATHGRPGPASRALQVRTPFSSCTPMALAFGLAPGRGAPGFAIGDSTRLTMEMVDRVLWRAGFGPSDADRHRWTGRKLGELVDWLLGTPQAYAPSATPALNDEGTPVDPIVTNPELVLEWLDRMMRAVNPLVERLNFFWHRHWAVSRNDGVPAQFLLAYRNRLARFSDLASNPQASFRALAVEMTTQDAAMSIFLNQNQNVKAHPNENYAREFMELFCLGITSPAGAPNYTQTDVEQLARAFTGYGLDRNTASPRYGQVTFNPRQYDAGVKTILGQAGSFDAPAAVNVVLAHPSHAPHLVAKLWGEFIATPIPPATLADLSATYAAGGALLIAPLVRLILTHPLLFESLCEPNLIKPPVVHAVGALRALGAGLKGSSIPSALGNMQQLPYSPPNVSGWEGGLSWLNSSTAEARFDLVVRAQNLKYGGYPGTKPVPDLPGEKPGQAFSRAWASVGAPWLSPKTRAALGTLARSAPAANAAQRRQRIYSLQASILGGPDGQVM